MHENGTNNISHNEDAPPPGDNWEVVSTSNEPATSIDGAASSSAEAFVVGAAGGGGRGVATNGGETGPTQHNLVRAQFSVGLPSDRKFLKNLGDNTFHIFLIFYLPCFVSCRI